VSSANPASTSPVDDVVVSLPSDACANGTAAISTSLATTPAASIATVDANPQRCSGVVKAWVEERGMGFLTPNAGGEDIFVHRSDLSDGQWLVVGAHVTWEDGWDPGKSKE